MLSDRQIQLLAHIIDEYMESPRPVGSTYLVKKYDLDCSAATVRNEMAELIEQGFLEMLHTSSGRIPTSQAYKFFLQELLEEDEIPVLQEVAIKQQVWGARYEIHKLLQELVTALADFTKELTIATTEEGFITHSGSVNLLNEKEFWDIEVAKSALSLVDRYELLRDILKKPPYDDSQQVYCLVGDDLPGENLKQCSIATTKYITPRSTGFLAVLGPARMNYEKIIPAVRYAKNLIEELVQ
jgi:transcriptional regulator of heat shock response